MLKTGKNYFEKPISIPNPKEGFPIFSTRIHGRSFGFDKIIDGHKVQRRIKGSFRLRFSTVIKNNNHFFERVVKYVKKDDLLRSKGTYYNNKNLKNI